MRTRKENLRAWEKTKDSPRAPGTREENLGARGKPKEKLLALRRRGGNLRAWSNQRKT